MIREILNMAEMTHETATQMIERGDTKSAADVYRTLAQSLDHLSFIQTLQAQYPAKEKE